MCSFIGIIACTVYGIKFLIVCAKPNTGKKQSKVQPTFNVILTMYCDVGNNHYTSYYDRCRITAAASNYMYDWLSEMYKSTDESSISSFNYRRWDVGNVSMYDVYVKNAHKKEHMVVS